MSQNTNKENENNFPDTNQEIDNLIKYILNAGKNKMWFDYEALFKKTKSFVLKQDNNIEVDHTDFDNDIVARDCLSDGKKNYAYYINNILNGDINIQYQALLNIANYAIKLFALGFETLYNEDDCKNVPLNFKLLCANIVAFNNYLPENDKNNVIKQYLAHTNGITPDFITSKIIPESLSDVTKYIKFKKNPDDNEE